jgi:hypothetical protein
VGLIYGDRFLGCQAGAKPPMTTLRRLRSRQAPATVARRARARNCRK